jgi:hypothetical protein
MRSPLNVWKRPGIAVRSVPAGHWPALSLKIDCLQRPKSAYRQYGVQCAHMREHGNVLAHSTVQLVSPPFLITSKKFTTCASRLLSPLSRLILRFCLCVRHLPYAFRNHLPTTSGNQQRTIIALEQHAMTKTI